MKVVVDTNLFVSALIVPAGIPARILRHAEQFQLYVSSEILDELARVLHYPRIKRRYKLADATISAYLDHIAAASIVVEVHEQVDVVKDDPDDNKFLACAVVAQADYIVSGDLHLRNLGSYQTVSIITPRQFLQMLSQAK